MARRWRRSKRISGPIVLAVFNAGNYIATPGEDLRVRDFRRSFEVNYFGIINGLVPLMERMRIRPAAISCLSVGDRLFRLADHRRLWRLKAAINILAKS